MNAMEVPSQAVKSYRWKMSSSEWKATLSVRKMRGSHSRYTFSYGPRCCTGTCCWRNEDDVKSFRRRKAKNELRRVTANLNKGWEY